MTDFDRVRNAALEMERAKFDLNAAEPREMNSRKRAYEEAREKFQCFAGFYALDHILFETKAGSLIGIDDDGKAVIWIDRPERRTI